MYPRSIESLLGIVLTNFCINSDKFSKGSLEFHNDRFVDNYESSLLDFVLKKKH